MKKILFTLFVALISVSYAFGGPSHSTHYGKITIGASAGGKVYLSASQISAASITDAQWTTKDTVITFNCSGNGSNDTKTYYGYAKADSGYLFAGWGTSKSATSFESTNESDFAISCTASSTTESSPTSVAKYAVFKKGARFYATQTIQAKAKDSNANSNGSGKVFINTANNKTNAVWANSSTTSSNNISETTSAKVTFYAFAFADEGVFYGWYDASGNFKSASNPYTVSVTSTSTDSSNPTQGGALYAYFRTTVDTKYGRAIVNVQTSSKANGLVFASTTNLNWKDIDNEIRAQFAAPCTSLVKSAQEQTYGVSMPFYVYAVPKRGFKLQSWSTSATGSAGTSAGWKADGVANPLTYSITASSTNQAKPTDGKSCFAMFVANSATCNITYKKPTNGNFTIQCLDVVDNAIAQVDMLNTDTLTADKSISHYTSDVAVLTAQPADGYKVYRWVSYDGSGNVASILAYGQNEYVFTTSSAQTIGVEFIQGEANFKIKESNEFCTTLQDAIDKATAYVKSNSAATIVPLMDYTVPAGDYTIPAKVTLLIPFDDANTCYTTEPVILHGWRKEDDSGKASSVTDPSTDQSFVYRTLTLASGAQLNIEGTLSLSAKRWCVINTGISNGTYSNANPSGSNRIHKGFGLINMENSSSIQVKSNGKLYCWGRIRGGGEITAKSGSEVRESYVYTDWRNNDYFGTYTRKTRCFPQNQYYIQDIQVPITYESGSSCLLEGALFYSSGTAAQKGTMRFVGAAGNSFIELPDGATMTKKYVASEDRLYIDMNNGASFNNFELNYSSWKVKTSTHIFTITNNWTVNVNSGTTTINYDLGWAPGSILNIKQGAAVTMLEGVSMYIYDHDDWGDFAAGRRIQALQKPSQEAGCGVTVKTRTYDNDCPDAEIIVNGTLTVTGGENKVFKSTDSNCEFDSSNKGNYQSGLYTTDGGANIHGTGSVAFEKGCGDQTKTQQLNLTTDWNTNTAESNIKYYSYTPISRFGTGMARPTITSAKLVNKIENNAPSYYSTTDAASRTTFIYNQTKSEWEKLTLTIIAIKQQTPVDTIVLDAIMVGDKISTAAQLPSIQGYTAGSKIYRNASCTEEIPDAMTASHLTAYILYVPNTNTAYTVKHYTQNLDDEFAYTLDSTENKTGTTDTDVTPDYISIPGFEGSTSQKITIAGDGSAVAEVKYSRNSYTISFNSKGGTEVDPITQKYESAITAPAAPIRTGFTFNGWDPIFTTMPAKDTTCVAQWEKKIISIDVKEETTTIDKGEGKKDTANVNKTYNVEKQLEARTVTIEKEAKMNIAETGSLTISDTLVFKAVQDTSCQLLGAENIEVLNDANVYFDFTINGKAFVRAKQNWYAFAVPFEVDPYSIQYKNGDSQFAPIGLGTAIDIMYYDGEVRAANGISKNAWKYVEYIEGDKTLKPGTFYLAAFAKDCKVLRFPKKAGADLISNNEISTPEHSSSVGTDANWNGIANPSLYYTTIDAGDEVTEGQTYRYTEEDGESNYQTVELSDAFSVGKPVFIQSKETLAIAESESAAGAPIRLAKKKAEKVDVRIFIQSANEYSDRIFIATNEEAKGVYTIGADIVKAGVATKRPQIWVNNYNQKLCKNTVAPVNNIAEYALGISVPATGAYIIQQASVNEGTLYLTLNGEAIANLTESAYTITLSAGTNLTYGLRWVRTIPGVVTDLDEAAATAKQGETEKLIKDNHLLLINNGNVFDAQGAKLQNR